MVVAAAGGAEDGGGGLLYWRERGNITPEVLPPQTR